MKKFFRNKYFFSFITLTCSGMAILIIYNLLFKNADSYLFDFARNVMRVIAPILYGFVIAYVLTPMLNRIEKKIINPAFEKLKIKKTGKEKIIRSISVLLTLIFAILLITLFVILLIPQVIESVEKIALLFPTYVNNTSMWINTKLKDYPEAKILVENYLNDYSVELQNFLTGDLIPAIQSILKSFSTNVFATVVGVIRLIWNLIIGLIVSFYMLYSKELFAGQTKRLLYSFFPEKRANAILNEVRFIHKTFIGFFAGKIVDSFIIALICFAGCTIFQIPYPMLISIVIGVTNIIPFIGPLIGAIPASLLIFVVDPKACLYFIIFIIFLQALDGNIIGPKILGESTGLSTFWVIFAITCFGGLFGVGGILIGVPLFAVIYAYIKDLSKQLLRDKGLPDYTSAYTYLDNVKDGNIILMGDNTEPENNEGVVITIKVDKENENN